jgi:hypothetical protein
MSFSLRSLIYIPALWLVGSIFLVQAAEPTPFSGKIAVTPHIYTESATQFSKWSGAAVPQGAYDPQYYARSRLGTVAFGPDLKVHVDIIRDLVHFPSYYELIDTRSGAVLGKYAVFDGDDAAWYFSGNGSAYLNQTHLSLCGPRYTRKIAQSGKSLAEVVQPLVYIGAETEVESPTQLYDSPTGSKVVATVVPGSKVLVLGLVPGKSKVDSAYLVKTPFGLTGWHVPRDVKNDGRLSIYQCN